MGWGATTISLRVRDPFIPPSTPYILSFIHLFVHPRHGLVVPLDALKQPPREPGPLGGDVLGNTDSPGSHELAAVSGLRMRRGGNHDVIGNTDSPGSNELAAVSDLDEVAGVYGQYKGGTWAVHGRMHGMTMGHVMSLNEHV